VTEIVTCRSLAAGGRAVARLSDGRVAFVVGAAPGETVEIHVDLDKGRFVEATAVRIVEPSPDRVEPRCAHFGECGGCSWQFLSYPAQLSAKVGILEDSLSRLARLPTWPTVEAVGPDSPWGGRNRAQFQPPADPGGAWGFFAAGSRRTVELRECPVLADELQGAWNDLRGVRSDRFSERRDRSAFAWGGQGRRLLKGPGLPDPGPAEVDVGGKPLRFSVDGFFQGHLGLLPRMVEETVGAASGNVAWDLYSGVGLFASRLEDSFGEVHAVESDPLAARYAPGNLARATHHAMPVEDWLESAVRDGRPRPDFVVVDPPRQGMTARALGALLAARPARIRYVSCGHDTFARDLRAFGEAGWRLSRIVLLDLYPHTPHMETVATLEPE
jgi:23S rRNA (uracil1939-C5)-methyltransferase